MVTFGPCNRSCMTGISWSLQERNKPIEPPKKPAQAPFFLPTVPGLARDPVFDLDGAEEKDAGAWRPSAATIRHLHKNSCA